MIKAVEDLNVTWPIILEYIRKYLGDCGCAGHSCKKWGKAETIAALLDV